MKHYIIGSLLAIGLVGKAIHVYFSKCTRQNTTNRIVSEVLFFPDSEYPCQSITQSITRDPCDRNKCLNPSCRRLHGRDNENPSSMLKFLDYLAEAKIKVDLCIYMFTESTLASVLSELHKENVEIRIITDGTEDDGTGSQVERLRKLGIKIKSNKRGTGALMHHKFVVIDDTLLLSGSFNWTNKAVVSNYEAVLVTSNESLVRPFVEKFDELWLRFSEHPRRKTYL